MAAPSLGALQAAVEAAEAREGELATLDAAALARATRNTQRCANTPKGPGTCERASELSKRARGKAREGGKAREREGRRASELSKRAKGKAREGGKAREDEDVREGRQEREGEDLIDNAQGRCCRSKARLRGRRRGEPQVCGTETTIRDRRRHRLAPAHGVVALAC